jgi:hypothetical protein
MRKNILFLLLVAISQLSLAQSTFWKQPYTGINFNVNLPAIKSISGDTLSMKTEWGTSIFFEFGNKKKWAHQSSVGFDRIKYNHNFEHQTTLNNTLVLGLTSFYSPDKMKGTRLFLGLEPSYILSRKTENIDGSKGGGIVQKSDALDGAFDLGLKLGLSLEFKPHIALNISYKEMFQSRDRSNGFGGIPDQIQIGLQVNFSKIKNTNNIDQRAIAKQEVKRLRDSSLLLFVINSYEKELDNAAEGTDRTELEERINETIDAQINAIKLYYKYSNYAICMDYNMQGILYGEPEDRLIYLDKSFNFTDTASKIFVARIGDFVLESNQSTRSGVFIFDNGMNLYQIPFPFFTSYFGLEHFLSDADKLFAMISNLNEKLYLLNQSN